MRAIGVKRTASAAFMGLAIAFAAWFAWPQPIPVDLATVAEGPMDVTVEDEGKTRVRHVYTVSAPVTGKVLRTPRHVGDRVVAGETVVAMMQTTVPGFLDVRSREELQAALTAAAAAVELAEHEVHRIEASLEFARSELRRAQTLADRDVIAARALDQARVDVMTNEHALAGARARLEVRQGERASMAARLIDPAVEAPPEDPAQSIQLRAPVSGRVLTIFLESEAVVGAGAPLVEIGDPLDLEVVVDLLSTEAVQVELGSPVRIDGWGGPPIQGQVTRVDPAGFSKVSALGIEEQRVRTVIDLVDPPEIRARLGHDFRVIVHIALWSADDVLTVPVAALFRQGEDWAVFTVGNGRARITVVEIGRRNNRSAQVLGGLVAGDRVIVHPSDRISDGVVVREREIR